MNNTTVVLIPRMSFIHSSVRFIRGKQYKYFKSTNEQLYKVVGETGKSVLLNSRDLCDFFEKRTILHS